MLSIYASKTLCSSSQCNPLSQAAFYTGNQDSSATSMDTLGKMLPSVLRIINQPCLKIKFQKTDMPQGGEECVLCACATARVFCTRTPRAIFVGRSRTVALPSPSPRTPRAVYGRVMALTRVRAPLIRKFQRYNRRPHKRWLVFGPRNSTPNSARRKAGGKNTGGVELGRAAPLAGPTAP